MQLKKPEFDILEAAYWGTAQSQRQFANFCGISLGLACNSCHALEEANLMDSLYRIAPRGQVELERRRTQHLVVIADRFDARLAPYTHERPKCALRVGEATLVERIIEQAHAAGIAHVTIVVGSRMEYLFYLEETEGVRLVVNSRFDGMNGATSFAALGWISAATYVVDGGLYFRNNPFRRFEYGSYVLADDRADDAHGRGCIGETARGRLVPARARRSSVRRMLPFVYVDEAAASQLNACLPALADVYPISPLPWEACLADAAPGRIERVRASEGLGVVEVDGVEALNDLRAAEDPADERAAESGSFAIDNICRVFSCASSEVHDIAGFSAADGGYLFSFTVNGVRYRYRQRRLPMGDVRTNGLVDAATELRQVGGRRVLDRFEAGMRCCEAVGRSVACVHRDAAAGWEILGGAEPADRPTPDAFRTDARFGTVSTTVESVGRGRPTNASASPTIAVLRGGAGDDAPSVRGLSVLEA